MAGRHVGNFERAMLVGIPPFKFDNVFEAEIRDEIEDVMGHDERRRLASFPASLACDGTQRLTMKMIKMRVRHEHDIHRRKIAQAQPGTAEALQNEEPAGEVGIDDYVHAADLQKEAGVAYEGDSQIAIRNQLRFVGLAGSWGDGRMPHEPSKLRRSSAKCRILQ